MLHTFKFCMGFITCMMIASTSFAQKTTTRAAKDTVPKTKADKMIADANNYTKMAGDVKDKLKSLFPVKSGDTMYFVIANITYTDPNLKMFKQKLSAIKNTKNLTSGYKNNTAIVKILFKGGDASTLYDNLDDSLKDMFSPEDMEGNRAILSYKSGTPPSEPKEPGKPVAATKVN